MKAITGLVLAGGLARRMGGVDKGLQLLAGRPLIEHVLERLEPQIDTVLINANRELERYAAFGHTIVPDADASFAGPLAGLLAGLNATRSDWLLSVPCDAPLLPLDLAERLDAAGADLAVPITADGQIQPVFCLLRRGLQASLNDYLASGGRKFETWLRSQPHALVPFDLPGDAEAFFNANSRADLQALEARP